MPVLTEQPSMGDGLKYEVNPDDTREVITLQLMRRKHARTREYMEMNALRGIRFRSL